MYTIKYQPKKIDDLDYGNKDLLKKYCTPADSFRSIILYGRNGVGKRTRAYTILNELYGEDVYNNSLGKTTLNGNKKIIINFKYTQLYV